MNTSTHPPSSQRLVHHLLAAQLQVDPAFIRDVHTLDELALDPLDLVLVVLRLEDIERGSGEFPLARLEHAITVGELVAVVDGWLDGEALSSSLSVNPSRQHQVA